MKGRYKLADSLIINTIYRSKHPVHAVATLQDLWRHRAEAFDELARASSRGSLQAPEWRGMAIALRDCADAIDGLGNQIKEQA